MSPLPQYANKYSRRGSRLKIKNKNKNKKKKKEKKRKEKGTEEQARGNPHVT
jgi:hypothetical protein